MTKRPVPTPALYETVVRHVRAAPVHHAFAYRGYYWLVDVDRLPRPPWPLRALAGFEARDHGGPPHRSLRTDLEAYLHRQGIHLGKGQILMLTQARVLGHVFNPITVYWCHDAAGGQVCTVAEVHNTYGQRHRYLLRPDRRSTAAVDKVLYVSPFHPAAGRYRLSLPRPEAELDLVVALHTDGRPPFVATLRGRRHPATAARLLRMALRYPLAPLVGALRIRIQGVLLAMRGVPRHPPPPPQACEADQDDAPAVSPRQENKEATMTVTVRTERRPEGIDADRWPDVARVPWRPLGARAAKLLIRGALSRTAIRVSTPDGDLPGAAPPDAPLLQLRRPERLYHRLADGGPVGFGEAYLAGDWDSPDLVALLTRLARDYDALLPPITRTRRRPSRSPRRHLRVDGRAAARRNIAHHYDLSNELFALFLDETMTYSGALFEGGDPRDRDGLAVAQKRKIDALLEAAQVGPQAHLLEIGTGWGELAIRAAKRGARVTTVTLSRAQADFARRRIADAGVGDRVVVRRCDYRDLTGRYDAVVSVEMVEAIGERQWPVFCTALDRLLAPGGRVALQSITMHHPTMVRYRHDYSWMHKYVFPGGLIPSVYALEEELRRRTTLRITRRRAFGPGYADTLRIWRETFDARLGEVAALGFDTTFQRLWNLYLAYSEAGFRSRILGVEQLIMERDRS